MNQRTKRKRVKAAPRFLDIGVFSFWCRKESHIILVCKYFFFYLLFFLRVMTLVAQYQNSSQRLKLQIVQQRSKYQETKTIEIPLSPLHHCRRLWRKKPISLWASFPGWCFAEQSSEQPSTLSPFVPHLLLARNHSALILPHTQFHFFAKQMCHTPTHAHTHIHTSAYTHFQPKVENLDK